MKVAKSYRDYGAHQIHNLECHTVCRKKRLYEFYPLLGLWILLLGLLFLGINPAYAAPSLLVDKRVNKTNPTAGEIFRYTIRYRCASLTEHCTSAQIVDAIPNDLVIHSYSPASGNIIDVNQNNNSLTWLFNDPLPAGSTGALYINVSFPACGDTPPSPVTNSVSFSASNATMVNASAPTVTMAGTLNACPPPPDPPTSDFRKTMESVRINGAANSRIYSDSSASADYVVEDYFPAGMIITRLDAWSRGFEIQCGGTANWYTIPPNDVLQTPSDISGFADCVSVSAGPALSGAARGSEYFNITGLRYTVPQGNSTWFDIMYTVTESNPFTTAQLPNWTTAIVGNQIQNCAERMDTNVQSCDNGEVYKPELYIAGFKELFMSPETGWNDPKGVGFNIPALTEDASTNPPRTLGPSDLVYYISGGVSHQSSYDWVDPVFIELLEAPLSFDPKVNWWSVHFANVGDMYLNPSYSLLNNPACNTPEFTVTENFANTGRTLLVWKFNGCTLPRNFQYTLSVRIAFSATIKPGTPAGTLIENIAMFPIPTHIEPTSSDALHCTDFYSQNWAGIRDELDFDGNGDTSELLCKVGRLDYPYPAPAYTVPVISGMNSSKYVQGKLDSKFDRYPSFGDTDQTGEGTYELFIENVGNVDVTQFDIIDFLPFVGDTGVLSANGARESTWEMQLADAVIVERYNSTTGTYEPVPASDLLNGEIKYANSNNPCRFNGVEGFDNLSVTGDNPAGCSALISGNAAGAKSFGFRFTPATPFAASEKLKITVKVAISGTPPANSGDIAWNSFAYGGIYQDGGDQPLINSEPIKVGLRMVDTANRAALGDVVWFDTNHDGIQDATEAGIANVSVNLYAADGTSLLDSTNTDSNGFYRFDNLDPATPYVIKLDNPSNYSTGALAGLQLTLQNQGADNNDNDAALNANNYPEISVTTNAADGNPTTGAAGSFIDSYDFGFWQPAALGNYVWYDVDGFGDQSNSELPVQNMTVNLYDSADNLVDSATTDATGHYLFDPLAAGQYYLIFDKATITGTDPITNAAVNPADWTFTALNATGNPQTDSDVNGAGRTIVTVLEAGERDLSWDAGIKPYAPPADPVSVGDYVWEDLNNNGVQDGGEQGIENVRVDLIENGFPTNTTYTNSTGYYQFDNLERNTSIQIRFTPPAGTALTSVDQGGDDAHDSDADPISGDTVQFTLNPTVATTGSDTLDPTWDAGIINTTLSLGNQVWLDSNKDGLYSVGEPTLAGLTVNLLGDATATTTTDSKGRYLFTGLAAGTYQVEVEILEGLSATVATVQSANPDSGTDSDHNGVDTSSRAGFARSNPITLESGGGDWQEADHGVSIGGVVDSTADRNADYTVDFGFIEGTVAAEVELGLTKTVNPTSANSGDTVTYTLTVSNNSAADATNVAVTDQLPNGISYVNSSATLGNYDNNTGIWSIPALTAGTTATLTLDVTVD
jgi:uncharacterized repeat protein (TIGR01451 family)